MINLDLVPHPPVSSAPSMALFWYFKRKEIARSCPSRSSTSSNPEVCSAISSNNSKKRGQYGKYTPEQKAMIGKRAAEHGVVANLCIPDRFILVVTSYHRFHFETRGHSSMHAQGVWFRLDQTTNITHHYNSEHPRKFYAPPPPPQVYIYI